MSAPRTLSSAFFRTPTRTLVREWLSRGDTKELLTSSNLPEPLRERISLVVRRARLWPGERRDVARELISHFTDGVASGASPETLLRDFGDPDAAARLIRRAKRRGRPLWWRGMHAAVLGLGAVALGMLVVYAWLTVRYLLATPSITRNITQELNARIDTIAEGDRAAPLYARLLALKPFDGITDEAFKQVYPDVLPGEPAWPAAVNYHARHTEMLALAREAASKPSVGLRYANQLQGDFRPRDPATGEPIAEVTPDPNPPMYSILLPQLGAMRAAARLLTLDLRVALSEHDASRIAPNLGAMLRVRDQAAQEPFLISMLFAQAIESMAAREVCVVLREHAPLMRDEELVSLAHRLSSWDAARGFNAALSSEREMVLDVLQRMFTDDGHGDGSLTPEGIRFLRASTGASGSGPAGERLLHPGYAGFVAGRREQLRKYDEFLGAARADLAVPIWELPADSGTAALESMSRLDRARYTVVNMYLPALSTARRRLEAGAHLRDAALTAIALELHRRRTGQFPDSLEAISATLLPATPLDRFDGRTLRYAVRDGRPVLYCVGPDLADDHGREGVPEVAVHQYLGGNRPLGAKTPSGDVVLYPVARSLPSR